MTGNYAALYRQITLEAENDSPDGTLLARFASNRDERAFAELVRRHGPMVFGVCRRTVGHHHDAEDAFQATFLVLAKKAGQIGQPTLLGNWLYGVAVRVAAKARQRASRERTGVTLPEPSSRPAETNDVMAEIDTELARLPAHYRDAVLLCDVQGVSRPDAAARLGVPDGTLSSRLVNGRKKLAARLAKKGIAVPAAGTFLVVVPDAIAGRAVEVAVGWSTGATVPESILELTRIGGSAMRYSIGAFVLTSIGLAAGAAMAWPQEKKPDPQPPPPPAVVVAAKPDQKDELVSLKPRRLKTIPLTFDASRQVMFWSSDGRYLAVTGPKTCSIVDTKTFSQANTLQNSNEPGHTVVGFLPGSSTLVTRLWERGTINGSNQLTFWTMENINPEQRPRNVKDQFWLKVDHRLELDDEQAEFVQIQPDGKTILTLHAEPAVPGEGKSNSDSENRTYVVRILDLTTGNPVKEVPLGDLKLKAFGTSPDGTKLFVTSVTRKGYHLQYRSLTDGKVLWESNDEKRIVMGAGDTTHQSVTFGRTGDVFAVALGKHMFPLPKQTVVGNPDVGTEVKLFESSTGKPLETDIRFTTEIGTVPGGFSPDGRLFAVSMISRTATSSLVQIWNVTTGKVVKQWSGVATTSFAPDRPLLAILETGPTRDETGQQVRRSTIGFWDCTVPAK